MTTAYGSDQEEQDPRFLERQARKRVREEREFYVHAVTYVLVNAFLIAINLMTGHGYFWAIWPLLGWGIGLASHAFQIFGVAGLFGSEWEERKVRAYMLQRQHGLSAPQVRALLRDELQANRQTAVSPAEWDRLVRRIEHLEAIVTSAAWEQLEARSEPDPSPPSEPSAPTENPAEQAERLARRVR